jgi:tRNA dimethylallyltransferase
VPPTEKIESPFEWLIVGVSVPSDDLHHNIHTRLRERLELGMVEEVERLHKEGVTWERFDDLGLEYRYIAQFLQNHLTYDEMLVELEIKIRQYAKRQSTWLKKDADIEWFESTDRPSIFTRIENFLEDSAS